MNLSPHRFNPAATHVARHLHEQLGAIASDVRELREVTDTDPPSSARDDESVTTGDGDDDRSSIEPKAPTSPAAPRPTGPGRTAYRAPSDVRSPEVSDMRPSLAELNSAMESRHLATVQLLQQMTQQCRSQQAQIERMSQEMSRLTSRLNVMAGHQ